MPGELKTVARNLCATLPEIVECDRVTGEDCFVARAHLKSIEDLERLIDQHHPPRDDHDLDHPVHPRQAPPAADRVEHCQDAR